MNEELKQAFETFKKAVDRLEEGMAQAKSKLAQDGVTQRFEFSFELAWKTLKIFLYQKGVKARLPKDVLKEAFKAEYLSDEKAFLGMLEDRNKTSHLYDEAQSEEIFKRIKNQYVRALRELVQKLEKVLNEN